MRIAVTGRYGQVVTALLERAGDVEIVTLGRPEFDLADARNVASLLRDIGPDAVVSAAAYTAVDKAEVEPDLSQAVNAEGPAHLAVAAAALDIPIIHLSTDYVFDGKKVTPYVEVDATGPLGVYGRTKLDGERAVAAATPNHAILRTAWVYSPFGPNFLKTMLRLAAGRSEVGVVGDQWGNPTSALDIADAVLEVTRNLLQNPSDARQRGIFHMTAAGEASWADFAREIFAASADLRGPTANVKVIGTVDYPTPAKRPANSRLNSSRLARSHGVTLPDWRDATREIIARVVGKAN
jgi:dTDP-4-dehydrorhamnose reductase